MAITTLFELATQHGEISAHMSRYLQRQKHTFDIIREQNGLGDRVYRVFKGDKPDPIFQYRIPERTSTETAGMWAFKVKRELDREWKLQTAKPQASVPTNTTSGLVVLDEVAEVTPEMWNAVKTASTIPTSPAPSPSGLQCPDCGPDGSLPDCPSISSSPTSSSTPTTPASEQSSSVAGASARGDCGTSPPPPTSKTSSETTTRVSKKASKAKAS